MNISGKIPIITFVEINEVEFIIDLKISASENNKIEKLLKCIRLIKIITSVYP